MVDLELARHHDAGRASTKAVHLPARDTKSADDPGDITEEDMSKTCRSRRKRGADGAEAFSLSQLVELESCADGERPTKRQAVRTDCGSAWAAKGEYRSGQHGRISEACQGFDVS